MAVLDWLSLVGFSAVGRIQLAPPCSFPREGLRGGRMRISFNLDGCARVAQAYRFQLGRMCQVGSGPGCLACCVRARR